MYQRLINNHILATLVFLLVLVLGAAAYITLPRQQDPSVNFNWVEIHTRFPGASALDVEKRVTDVLEQGVQRVGDIRFSMSESRPGLSRIVVRFHNLDKSDFDDHVTALRREVQNQVSQLPDEAKTPEFLQINSDNGKPAVMLLAVGHAYDATLREEADRAGDDIERFASVDHVQRIGMRDPELQVRFNPTKMQGLGVSPAALADTVRSYFRDRSVGSLALGDQKWLVRLAGTRNDPHYLENLPLVSASGEVPLRSVAQVVRGLAEPTEIVRYQGKPAILLCVFKNEDSNLLHLVDRVRDYAHNRNSVEVGNGIRFVILDDQTGVTRHALEVMESNAVVGLALVLMSTWALLGLRIAVFSSMGIPFALAGTLAIAALLGETLNVVVLLGLVISLGMLVDDAVVIAEAIHYRMQRGQRPAEAAIEAIHEVGAPVVASVLTTIAAFIPLMLIPGILGEYMFVTPLVVTTALLLSLLEAFWMLPSHMIAFSATNGGNHSRADRIRSYATWWLRNRYTRFLVWTLRHPRLLTSGVALLFGIALALLLGGFVRIDYFATDSARLFYINVDMPPGTSLEKTLATTQAVEQAVRPLIKPNELHEIASYAGLQIAESDTVMSDNAGQVAVSLLPVTPDGRNIDQIIDAVKAAARRVPGPENLAFLEVRTGPPVEPPVMVKVRGDHFSRLTRAAKALKKILHTIPAVHDIRNDDVARQRELTLQLDPAALVRSHLDPAVVTRDIQLLADGEVVASMRDGGNTLDVRVRAQRSGRNPVDDFLGTIINLPQGGTTTLGQLVHSSVSPGRGDIRHQNFRRAITITADLDRSLSDTLAVNRTIRERWDSQFAKQFPDVSLDFSGEMDDIKESLNSLGLYFLLGLILIYIILSTQFRSYFQPMMVLVTVPTAFAGVVIGIAVSGYPLSLYTLYGVVALAGIAVNSAIVFVSAANERVRGGMTTAQATVFAARRRVMPIIITAVTTMAGLFSLAIGLAGQSNIWCPVASAIVWGLGVSTFLTLLITPGLYARFAPTRRHKIHDIPLPVPLERRHGARERLQAILSNQLVDRRRYQDDLAAIAEDNSLADAYRRGCQAMGKGDHLTAIKQFQHVADAGPDLVLANRAAAHAALALMYDTGWDKGYDARVRRFLTRALRRAPNYPDVVALKRLYQDLRTEANMEVQSPTVLAQRTSAVLEE